MSMRTGIKMKKKITPSKVPAAARSGFGRARPRASETEAAAAKVEQEAEKEAPTIFRIAGVQMASGPSVSANLNEAKRLIGMAVDQGAGLVRDPAIRILLPCPMPRPKAGGEVSRFPRLLPRPCPW